MFRLTTPTGTAQPQYMLSNLDLKSIGISYRLVPSSPKAPTSIAANAYIDLHGEINGEDKVIMSVRATVWNSQNRPGEIYVTGPSRQYESTDRNGAAQTRRSQDVLFDRDVLNALNKAIHLDLQKMAATTPEQDTPTTGAGAGADETLPDDFKQ